MGVRMTHYFAIHSFIKSPQIQKKIQLLLQLLPNLEYPRCCRKFSALEKCESELSSIKCPRVDDDINYITSIIINYNKMISI